MTAVSKPGKKIQVNASKLPYDFMPTRAERNEEKREDASKDFPEFTGDEFRTTMN